MLQITIVIGHYVTISPNEHWQPDFMGKWYVLQIKPFQNQISLMHSGNCHCVLTRIFLDIPAKLLIVVLRQIWTWSPCAHTDGRREQCIEHLKLFITLHYWFQKRRQCFRNAIQNEQHTHCRLKKSCAIFTKEVDFANEHPFRKAELQIIDPNLNLNRMTLRKSRTNWRHFSHRGAAGFGLQFTSGAFSLRLLSSRDFNARTLVECLSKHASKRKPFSVGF